jgi:septal ring factor EnvC (AmiA/AmiB activator)
MKVKVMFKSREEEILNQIKEIDFDLSIVRSKVKITKAELNSLETDLIGLKLSQEKLTEELQQINNKKVLR